MTSLPHDLQITQAQPADRQDVVAFVMQARAQMFPMLDPHAMPDDVQHFETAYCARDGGLFLLARQAGVLVGTIGWLPYDGRFAQLDYSGRKVVEVVRLFIAPCARRAGVAARLFESLKNAAVERGVEVLYLHTHPFLPGAITFWQRQGFAIVDTENDPVWQTTHMQRAL